MAMEIDIALGEKRLILSMKVFLVRNKK